MADSTKVWMPMYIGDLLADTMHLTAAEFGAYHWIMYHQWRNGAIPERSLRAVSRLSKDEWAESEPTIKAFLSVDENGCYFQKRTKQEKEKSDKISAVSRENGAKGGRPRNPDKTQTSTQTKPAGNPDHNPEGTRTETPSPSPSQSPSTLALTSVDVHAGVFDLPLIGDQGDWSVSQKLFDELVKAYPSVSVMGELGKMRAWLVANPKNRKTPTGLPRFINQWISKAQNNAPRPIGGNPNVNRSTEREAAIIGAGQAVLDARAKRPVVDGEDFTGRTLETRITRPEPHSPQLPLGPVSRTPEPRW